MKAVTPLSRHVSTVKKTRTLVSSVQNHPFLTEDSCFQLLDQYPDTKTLKKLHSQIIITPQLHPNPSLSIKLMRAYAACGETGVICHLFDEIAEENVLFFNVMIKSYVNDHLFHDALLVYKTLTSCGFEPAKYMYLCVLKVSSGLNCLRVGLQIHITVVKVGLASNLFIRSGLVAMYGKCGCLIEARRVLAEPNRNVVSWNSMVAGYVQNGGL